MAEDDPNEAEDSLEELLARVAAMEVVLLRLTGQVHGVQLLKAFEEVPAPEGLTPDSRRHHDAINRYLRSRAQIAAALLVRMKTSDSPH